MSQADNRWSNILLWVQHSGESLLLTKRRGGNQEGLFGTGQNCAISKIICWLVLWCPDSTSNQGAEAPFRSRVQQVICDQGCAGCEFLNKKMLE